MHDSRSVDENPQVNAEQAVVDHNASLAQSATPLDDEALRLRDAMILATVALNAISVSRGGMMHDDDGVTVLLVQDYAARTLRRFCNLVFQENLPMPARGTG
jgi:hypothetical protein